MSASRSVRKSAPAMTPASQTPVVIFAIPEKITAKAIQTFYQQLLQTYNQTSALKSINSKNDARYLQWSAAIQNLQGMALKSADYQLCGLTCIYLSELQKDMTHANHADVLKDVFCNSQQRLQDTLLDITPMKNVLERNKILQNFISLPGWQVKIQSNF
jgi:hypothetical protein